MNRPVHFEIHAENPERAAKFYQELFGWKVQKADIPGLEYWLLMTGKEGPGIDGAVTKRMGANPDPKEPTPVIAFVCTVDVTDLDATQAKAEKLGSVVALPKFAVPGVGWCVYLKDMSRISLA